MFFARRLSANGWVYDDKTEHAFALACSVWGFSLVGFDNFLEAADWSTPGAQANLKHFLKRRSEAIAAFTGKNLRLMRAIIEGLATQQELIQADEVLRPKAKHGSKFVAKKPGSAGPVRKVIAKALRKNPASSAEEVWGLLTADPPQNLEFYGTTPERRYIRRQGHPDTGWRRFQNIVSEERKKLTG
jgi:hypothetical protein